MTDPTPKQLAMARRIAASEDFCCVADGKPPEATQAFLPSPESDGKPFCRAGGSL